MVATYLNYFYYYCGWVSCLFSVRYDMSANNNAVTMISAFWSAVATIFLGAIALWQNKRYKTLSDESAKEIKKLTLTPECYLENIETRKPPEIPCKIMIPESGEGENYFLIFSSLNQPMINVTIREIQFFNKQGKYLSTQTAPFLTNFKKLTALRNYTEFAIEILIPNEYNKEDISCEAILEYKNIYNTTIRKEIAFDRNKDCINVRNIVLKQAELLI